MPSSFPQAGPVARATLIAAALALAVAPNALAGNSANNGLSISNPWVRIIIRARPASGYFTLKNDSDTAHQLVGAASPACGMAMLHQSKSVDGVEKMLEVKQVEVPAHGSITFAPGGYHVMCMKPGDAVSPGKTIPITLKFADGSNLTADFAVKSATGD
jgi:periplasmic copper chaperone A